MIRLNTRRGSNAPAWGVAMLLLVIIIAVPGCGQATTDAQPKKQPPLVSVHTATTETIVHTIDVTAEVVPVEFIEISAVVEGPIDFFPWREGDTVEAGEKLVEISRETYRAEVRAAEAALAVATARLNDLRAGTRPEEVDKARQGVREAEQGASFEEKDLERITHLVEIGALPGEELDKVRVRHGETQARLNAARRHMDMLEMGATPTALAVQAAAVEEAAAKVALAQARFNECTITAPFSGTVTKVFVRRGDMAAARASLLEMADMNSLVLRFAVPEAHAVSIRKEMPLTVYLDAMPHQEFSAEVVRIYPELNPTTRTRTVEAVVAEPVDLVPGMFARVTLTLAHADDVVVVPQEAVLVGPNGKEMVFVIEEGKAVQRPVSTGIADSTRVQIVSGVNPGEAVATAGNELLKPGMNVRVPKDSGDAPGPKGQGKGSGKGAGSKKGGRP